MLKLIWLLPILLVTACADHIGRLYDEAPRDLTGASLRSRLASGERVRADAFPLGAPLQGRRCGGALGTTQVPGLPARELLQSSIAWATDGLLGKPFQPGQTYERQLRAASIRHDYCYGHGLGTYGRTRKDCDLWLRADALRLCKSVEGSETRAGCAFRSEVPFLAVAPLGWTFYRDNLQATCEYDPGLNPPRDFVISGRFLRIPGMLPGQVIHVSSEDGALRFRITGVAETGTPTVVTLLDARLPLEAVTVVSESDEVSPDGSCPEGACSLGVAGLRPQDFLALAPKVADLDGDGLDDVAFVAIQGLRDQSRPAYGMVAFAIRPASAMTAGRLDPRRVAAGFVRTRDEKANAATGGTLSPEAIRQQIDVLGQTWLTGRFLPEPRDQLLLVALRVERGAGEFRLRGAGERGFAEFRMLDFQPDVNGRFDIGPPRMRRTLFRDDAVYFQASDDPRPLTELYRRFQNPPMRWRDGNGRNGVLLLARDWLDRRDALAFPVPSGVLRPDSQDRGVRVIAYGPPTAPSGAAVPASHLVTDREPTRSTGCADLAAGDPDWLGCRRELLARPTIAERFVWNWTREVNPVLELPDGSNRHAGVALAAAAHVDGTPLSPPREALVFFLTPSLDPEMLRRLFPNDHRFVKRYAVVPAAGHLPDGPDTTEAGTWLSYPALAARLGPDGQAGIALFRSVANGPGVAMLEIASAIPIGAGETWRVSRSSCPVSRALAAAHKADAMPGIEGGDMAHLRLSPVLRLSDRGPRDGFVVATRERGSDGEVKSDAVVLTVIRAVGGDGWAVGGIHCAPRAFQ